MSDKVETAIESLRLAAEMSLDLYGKPLNVAYSGGKDSDALVGLCEEAGIVCSYSHSLTTVDAPQTVSHVKEVFRALEEKGRKCEVVQPAYKGARTSMWSLIPLKLTPPTRINRYCCSVLKETNGQHRLNALGVRADESNLRKARGRFETIHRDKSKRGRWDTESAREVYEESKSMPEIYDCNLVRRMKEGGETAVNPIIDWTSADVYGYCEDRGIRLNPLYSMGYPRVGCIMCPMSGRALRERGAADFPSYYRAYMRAFGKMIEERRRRGKGCDWESAQEVMDWWLERGVSRGQMGLGLELE